MKSVHKPVLLKEVIEYLSPKLGQNFIDCTFGQGGHSTAIWEKIKPGGKILGIDSNPAVCQNYKLQITSSKLINDNFVNLKKIYEQSFPYPVNGILFDLGLSATLLEQSGRGFSFQRDEPLDMRFNPERQRLTAAEALNRYSLENLVRVFSEYGEYRYSKTLARNIVKFRKINKFKATGDLVDAVLKSDYRKRRGKIHPATQIFQALRIEVNNELENLKLALPQAVDILELGGRLAVISFHSLEDRIVKNCFRDLWRENKVKLLTKKPVTASEEEVRENPRSRSAKLRAVEIIKTLKH